jgi:two-component system chemotaxis response regulator CheY
MKPDVHFMVVDDYLNIRTLVKRQLGEFGFSKITEFERADTAIKFLESRPTPPVDFIISDWNMPGKTGLDFLQWVRSKDYLKNIPFLILTTENEQAKIISAVSAGVSNFLLKPWEAEELSKKIALCWKKHYPT